VRLLALILLCALPSLGQTAWKGGHFEVDPAGLVSRSDVILSQPNSQPEEAMPMGNGRLGIAVWAADGFTAQLNRADTWPHRDSPGQIVIPGLTALTSARDFHGRLDLYDGTLVEQGGGLTLNAYVQTSTDTFVVDVVGADPKVTQTALLRLWPPRTPQAKASGQRGMLAQTWVDHYGPGASGETFGAFAAITATGREVSATVTDPRTITVTFKPSLDGHFRVIVACPHYSGPQPRIDAALANSGPAQHAAWWHSFWGRAGLIKISSADGSGEYMENLRNLYLYTAAAENGDRFPGSQAGIADMFSAVQDVHHWDPAAFWHWNLRMQVAANLDAGVPELNAPYFRLYRENLDAIKDWTRKHMGGRPGICVPETMRFTGQGIEWEPQWNPSHPPAPGLDCDADSRPYYNARTLSTGAEISLWIWRQYLATGDRAFLAENYPVMQAAARFLLAYETPGPDGKMHTKPSNAHEQQWDTIDPTTDLSARSSLFPVVIEAARLLHCDASMARRLQAELGRIPALPQTGNPPVIAESYDPSAAQHNEENIGLEPVWPYNLIGDDSPMLDLAKATYAARPYPIHQDWSFDPVQAARLGLADEVRSTLIALTEKYQKYVNGFANWGGPAGEFYVEQEGVVALAIAEALVQDYDGLIRIAPAVPPQWTFEGTVWVRHRTRVHVQVHSGTITTVAIESGASESISIRNPWPGQQVSVVDAKGTSTVIGADTTLHFSARKGEAYRLSPAAAAGGVQPFAPLSGKPAQQCRKLGPVQIGN